LKHFDNKSIATIIRTIYVVMYHGPPRVTPPDDFYGHPVKRPQLNFIPPPLVDEEPDDEDVCLYI